MAKWLLVLPEPWSEGYYPNMQAVRQHWWPSESLEPIGSRTYLGSISIFQLHNRRIPLSRTVVGQFRTVADPFVADHFHAIADSTVSDHFRAVADSFLEIIFFLFFGHISLVSTLFSLKLH